MRIGELAKAAGVSSRALRYYEEQRLIIPDRSPSGQRHYSQESIDRVRWIQALYAAGLSSTTIADLFPGTATGLTAASVVDRLTDVRRRIDAQVSDLLATRDRLDALIDTAIAPHEGCRPPATPTR
ncbi:MerR family transcriptional regulator [Streptomyces subrutilus]|uniref:MerR family transcriptional regulator n=1 Tax=Streptomyces subrutilus TaxID=36818 RepID=UPI002E132D9B|nr:MerR family transcriptional regulator [Streptomyces subrutilus]